ncbi:uncharacterized mitochondrial protein AtMg00810-like [Arachis hypogaea]|uniref:uncharacterized mitochondrial protein AtMg00810-like n=1 Tax=Arachis hypogaea TaxID=3818 RepID=UPI003B21972F
MIIAGDDELEKQTLKEKLATQFEMKDLGKLKYFLGIEVAYSRQGIFIFQRKYILDLLKEIGKLDCMITGVPIEQNHKTENDEESPKVEKAQYQRFVEKLIHLSHTKPDIAYAVSVVSQFMHDPRERHLQAISMIIQYLKASPGKGLLLKKEGILSMKVYTDADYAGSIIDRRSTSGYCMFLGENLVTWRSDKPQFDVQHDRTKHVEIDRHFIKEKLDNGLIATKYIPSRLQLADMFTKGLPIEHLKDLTCKLGMIDIHQQTHIQGKKALPLIASDAELSAFAYTCVWTSMLLALSRLPSEYNETTNCNKLNCEVFRNSLSLFTLY